MSGSQAFQLFRSCASSVGARHAARKSFAVTGRRALGGARYYSEGAAKAGEASGEAPKAAESAQEAETVEVTPEAEIIHKLKEKEAEVVDLTGRLRYLQADYLNLQRNAAREKEQQRDFAITRFASDLLETADVLGMALKSVPESALQSSRSSDASQSTPPPAPSSDSSAPPPKTAEAYLNELHTGVEMTHRLLLQTLFKYNVKPFDPTGDKFDPNRHEALYQVPMPDKEPGTVIDCQKTGYTIKDRILRAAQVGIVQDKQS